MRAARAANMQNSDLRSFTGLSQAQLAGANAEIDRLKVCDAFEMPVQAKKSTILYVQGQLAGANAEIDRLKVCFAFVMPICGKKSTILNFSGPAGRRQRGDRPSQGVCCY